MKILVVDDDQIERRIIEKALTGLGHDIVLAEDGESAWKLIRDEGIRFVITDWSMPGLDGIQLAQKIRAAELPKYVYVILLTAKDKADDIVVGLNAGADDYLTKPFNPPELSARISVGKHILNLEDNLYQAFDQLERLAMVDSLTKLMNRRAIYKFARGELERARRVSGPISVIFLDIDQFKAINDQHGHLVGDEVLKAVARTIKERSRPYDGIGRWAGDEFLIVLPGVTAINAEKAAKRILDGITATSIALPDSTLLHIRISAGVATVSKVTAAAAVLDDIIQRADEALYRAKEAGGNQIHLTWL